jgi:hypothetical protein
MESRQARITCPCCESRLDIDVRTQTVVRWSRKEELDETGKPVLRESDWTDASTRVGQRLGAASDAFEAGLSKERSREKDLDDLFRKASDKLKGGGDRADE